MMVIVKIDVSTLEGRTILRDLEKHKKIVEIDYPVPVGEDGLALKKYTVQDAKRLFWEKLDELYGTDIR